MRLDAELNRIEQAIRDLILEWERYFAGDRRVPPQQERAALEGRLRSLSERIRRAADRFRLEQLQHRLMTYAQNWERLLREREEGRGRSVAALRAMRGAGPPTAAGPARSPGDGGASASVDRGGDSDLYTRYLAARRRAGLEGRVDREAFSAQIEAQRSRIEARLGASVTFDVVVEGGKVKLAARRGDSRRRERE